MKILRSFRFAALTAALFAASSARGSVVDLTQSSTGVVSTIYGDAIFTTDFTQPAGTGVIDPFLTVQANGVEQGYNTSAKSGVFDTKREPQWNHELQLKDLNTVTISGAQYYSFTIDVNEPGAGKSQISLDALKIFTSSTAGQTTTNVESLGTKRFDLDLPSDSYVLYDDQNSGSGQADIAFFIPTSAFAGVKSTDYIYMYQMFGAHVEANFDGTTQGGFEETFSSKVAPMTAVPEATTALPATLVLGSLIGMTQLRRRRSVKAA
jgi:hypothetical protein